MKTVLIILGIFGVLLLMFFVWCCCKVAGYNDNDCAVQLNEKDIKKMIKESKKNGNLQQLVLLVRPEVYEQIKDDIDNAYCFYKVIPCRAFPKDTNAIIMSKEKFENLFKLEVNE